MNRELERKFFAAFQIHGAAMLTLEMNLNEYCGIGNGTASRKDYPDGVLAQIKQQTEEFDVWPYGGLNGDCPLLDEIKDNIEGCSSDEAVKRYVAEILRKFQNFAWTYFLGAEKLNAIGNTVVMNSKEYFFRRWMNAYKTFFQTIGVMLAERDLNLIDIQKECCIKVMDKFERLDWISYFGSSEVADMYLARMEQPKAKKTKEHKTRKAFTRAGARKLFDEIRSMDWVGKDGKKCFGIKGDDPELFINMLLHGEVSTKKMEWVPVTPKDRNRTYIKPLVEILYLCGFSWNEIPEVVEGCFLGVELNDGTLRNIKSDIRKQSFSPMYVELRQAVESCATI